MGMAASQARLLSLTGRLHDVELSAQAIEAAKIALATQKDDLYQEYCDALDATAIKVAYMNGDATYNYIDANYNSLCMYNENKYRDYTIKDTKNNKIFVNQEEYDAFQDYGNDKYAFAWAMLGYQGSFDNSGTDDWSGQYVGSLENNAWRDEAVYMTDKEQTVFDRHQDDDDLVALYEEIENAESTSDKKEALSLFREKLYDKYNAEIFEEMNGIENKKTWDDVNGEFNHYLNLWDAINASNGCQVIDSEYTKGDSGADWLQNMVEAGLVVIQSHDLTPGKGEWAETSIATSTNESYIKEVQDDKDLKKAEAKYEHELDIINRKDTKYDTELSKLETERTSITTEMDAIKKVRDDNIDRTFGIFS